jgi:transposase-like protein
MWGDRWFVDEAHVKVSGVWRYMYRAPALANVIEDLVPAASHNTGQYENKPCRV